MELMEVVYKTSSFFVFLSLAGAGFIILLGGILLGGGHDLAHDILHDHGDNSGGDQPVSIWSIKVIATFIMVFGAAGSIAVHLGANTLSASLVGLISGLVMGYVALFALRALYANQSAPEATSASVQGLIGIVTTEINPGKLGEVEVTVGMGRRTYLARSSAPQVIDQGTRVKIAQVTGTEVLVEAV